MIPAFLFTGFFGRAPAVARPTEHRSGGELSMQGRAEVYPEFIEGPLALF
jgi:hypothetical protein